MPLSVVAALRLAPEDDSLGSRRQVQRLLDKLSDDAIGPAREPPLLRTLLASYKERQEVEIPAHGLAPEYLLVGIDIVGILDLAKEPEPGQLAGLPGLRKDNLVRQRVLLEQLDRTLAPDLHAQEVMHPEQVSQSYEHYPAERDENARNSITARIISGDELRSSDVNLNWNVRPMPRLSRWNSARSISLPVE